MGKVQQHVKSQGIAVRRFVQPLPIGPAGFANDRLIMQLMGVTARWIVIGVMGLAHSSRHWLQDQAQCQEHEDQRPQPQGVVAGSTNHGPIGYLKPWRLHNCWRS